MIQFNDNLAIKTFVKYIENRLEVLTVENTVDTVSGILTIKFLLPCDYSFCRRFTLDEIYNIRDVTMIAAATVTQIERDFLDCTLRKKKELEELQ